MHIVYRTDWPLDAYLVRDALADDGIGAFVIGDALCGAIGELPLGSGLVRVMVADADVDVASRCVADFERERAQRDLSAAAEPDDSSRTPFTPGWLGV